MTTMFISKLGTTRAGERTRIWIEGKRLTAAGFHVGDHFQRQWNEKDRSLLLWKIDAKTARSMKVGTFGKVSGKGEKPIIDITGAKVQATFGGFEHVVVSYDRQRITIECGTPIKMGAV